MSTVSMQKLRLNFIALYSFSIFIFFCFYIFLGKHFLFCGIIGTFLACYFDFNWIQVKWEKIFLNIPLTAKKSPGRNQDSFLRNHSFNKNLIIPETSSSFFRQALAPPHSSPQSRSSSSAKQQAELLIISSSERSSSSPDPHPEPWLPPHLRRWPLPTDAW